MFQEVAFVFIRSPSRSGTNMRFLAFGGYNIPVFAVMGEWK